MPTPGHKASCECTSGRGGRAGGGGGLGRVRGGSVACGGKVPICVPFTRALRAETWNHPGANPEPAQTFRTVPAYVRPEGTDGMLQQSRSPASLGRIHSIGDSLPVLRCAAMRNKTRTRRHDKTRQRSLQNTKSAIQSTTNKATRTMLT